MSPSNRPEVSAAAPGLEAASPCRQRRQMDPEAGQSRPKPFRTLAGLLLTALLLIASQGCLAQLEDGPARLHFYTLHYEPLPVAGETLPVILEIDPLTSGPNCDLTKMVYQDQELKRQEYDYHRWRAKPGPLLSSFLRRDLQESGLFKAVIPEESRTGPTHRLEGTVEEFYELDTEEGWFAVIETSLTLVDTRREDISGSVLMQRRYRIQEPAEAKTPKSVARAMSLASAELARQVAQDVHKILAESTGAAP